MTSILFTTFFASLAGVAYHRTHLLSALLCLEAMMLTIIISLAFWPANTSPSTLMLPLIVLTFSVCGAAVGLALMVMSVRSYGKDHLKTINLLQC